MVGRFLMFIWSCGLHITIRPNNYMGGYQNYGPILGPLKTRCCITLRNPKKTMILKTTHILIPKGLLKGLVAVAPRLGHRISD